MAPVEQFRLRTTFLNDASHLIAISSPAAAAFLGSTRDKLTQAVELELTPKELDASRRESCGACGNPLIPGWSCKVATGLRCAEKRVKGSLRTKDPKKTGKATTYTCLRCHRETTHVTPVGRVKKFNKTVLPPHEKPALDVKNSSQADQKVQKTINASSKQRQKARKGGLQAMLERNKTQTPKPGGLDWMDFAL